MVHKQNIFPQTALRELLLEILDESELRRFLFDYFGRDILHALPSSAPLADVFFSAVDILDRRGLVSRRFFQGLATRAPGKTSGIMEVARAWGHDLTRQESTDPEIDRKISILEELFAALRGPQPLSALELVTEHQSLFFPETADDSRNPVRYFIRVISEACAMTLVCRTNPQWISASFSHTCFILSTFGQPLFCPDTARGWHIDDGCLSMIEESIARVCTACAPVPPDSFNIYAGSRIQLDCDEKIVKWGYFKSSQARREVHVRTMEGFIDDFATQALGKEWYAHLPPSSPLKRPW